MPHFVSASVDETLLYQAKASSHHEPRSVRLSHAVSAVELRSSKVLRASELSIPKRRGLQRRRRAASSFPSPFSLNHIGPSTPRSVSKSGSSYDKESSQSVLDSKVNDSLTPISGLNDPCSAYPSPPATGASRSPSSSSCEDDLPVAADTLPFPLNPVPLPPLRFQTDASHKTPHTPAPRCRDFATPPSTPTQSLDRYISGRVTPHEASKTFHSNKSPHQLSVNERLLRHNVASPDPFGPVVMPRVRDTRANIPNGSPTGALPRPRLPIGTTDVTTVPDPLTMQNRQASIGAVWNIGGLGLTHHPGPIRSVSNGRGGFVSGGSNAPMYTSHFVDEDTMDQDHLDRLEARLAAALDIDQTVRILNTSRLPQSPRSVTTGAIGFKRKRAFIEPRTRWKNGDWVREGSQLRK